nr:hypothetical protein [Marinilactibacillus sp. Marseille-P9653]
MSTRRPRINHLSLNLSTTKHSIHSMNVSSTYGLRPLVESFSFTWIIGLRISYRLSKKVGNRNSLKLKSVSPLSISRSKLALHSVKEAQIK